MPRDVEVWLDDKKNWCEQLGQSGSTGLAKCKALGFKARFVGGILQVTAPSNPSDFGWIDETDALQSFTVSELEEFWVYNGCPMRVRLRPYREIFVNKGEIQSLTVSAKVTADIPDWKLLRDSGLAPGHCPCGTPRELCDYHR